MTHEIARRQDPGTFEDHEDSHPHDGHRAHDHRHAHHRRPVIRRSVALVVVAFLVAAGCGRSSPTSRALEATEDKLDDVRSGNLSLLLLAS